MRGGGGWVGLEVKDMKVVNLILLVKWRWRLIQHDNPLWKKVLKEKYGDGIGNLVEVVKKSGSIKSCGVFLKVTIRSYSNEVESCYL